MHRSSLLGDDGVKLFEVEGVVGVGSVHDVGVVHHFGQLTLVQGLTQLPGDSLEALEVHSSVSFSVPELEHSGDTFP